MALGSEVIELRGHDDDRKLYTFVYAHIVDVSKWRGASWKVVNKQFPTIEGASEAAGLWMRACFEHGCPIAVAVQEVSQ